MKGTLPRILSLALISILLSVFFVSFAAANPVPARLMGETEPDDETTPPTIQIISPEGVTPQNPDKVVVSFNVQVGRCETSPSEPAVSMYIQEVSFEMDWQKGNTTIYKYLEIGERKNDYLVTFSSTLNLTNIPGGNHNVTVHATAGGKYLKTVADDSNGKGYSDEYYTFRISNTSSAQFNVDERAPYGSPTTHATSTASAFVPELGTTDSLPDNFSLAVIVTAIAIILTASAAVFVLWRRRRH